MDINGLTMWTGKCGQTGHTAWYWEDAIAKLVFVHKDQSSYWFLVDTRRNDRILDSAHSCRIVFPG